MSERTIGNYVIQEKPTYSWFKDLEGKRFGRLVVLGYGGRRKRSTRWICKCDCGVIKDIDGGALKKAHSCGCYAREQSSIRNRKHGMDGKPEYKAWEAMRARCYRKTDKNYADYGGRGITVCQEWRDSFEAFLAHVGMRPGKGFSIGRIDNDGNYEKGNVRWETQIQQQRNKRTTRFLTINGETKPVSEWAAIVGINKQTITERLKRGWDPGRAVFGKKNPELHYLEFNGKCQTVTEWAREFGLPDVTLFSRIKAGWPIEEILSKVKRN